jgi:hypothetical protein
MKCVLATRFLDLRLFNFPSLEVHKPAVSTNYVETLEQDYVSY